MKFIAIILICVILGMSVALGGSQGGAVVAGSPLFLLMAGLAFAINWLAFIPAYVGRTEKYYDLTGSLTYLSVILTAAWFAAPLGIIAKITAALVCIWAIRLGSFLFLRIHRDGGDDRFDKIKTKPLRFLLTWTIQALWVVLTAACALAIITSGKDVPFGLWIYAGLALWVTGFIMEVVADRQKSTFRKNPDNKDRFITSGLWSWSRHPNYFGEITLWTGIALVSVPFLSGWQWVVMISPVFVTLLLTKVSGIPLLEKKARKKWGDDPTYQAYIKRTSRLIPLPPKTL